MLGRIPNSPAAADTEPQRRRMRRAPPTGAPSVTATRLRAGARPSCQSPRRGQPLIAALDRQATGCYRASNTCRARHSRPPHAPGHRTELSRRRASTLPVKSQRRPTPSGGVEPDRRRFATDAWSERREDLAPRLDQAQRQNGASQEESPPRSASPPRTLRSSLSSRTGGRPSGMHPSSIDETPWSSFPKISGILKPARPGGKSSSPV